MGKEQGAHKEKRQDKGEIAHPSPIFPWLLWNFKWKQVEDHGCPTGIAAPSPSEDLCHRVMNGCRLKNTCTQVIPEAFNLHILLAQQSEVDKHISSD